MDLGKNQVTHSFLVIRECPAPLLGRDLLTKLKAQIRLTSAAPRVTWGPPTSVVLALGLEEEYRLHESPDWSGYSDVQDWLTAFSKTWAESGGMGMAIRVPPVVVGLKTDAVPIGVRQYPMSQEAREEIRPHIQSFLQQDILIPCQSPWNTPLLPVKKPGTNDYRPVQDLREVNKSPGHTSNSSQSLQLTQLTPNRKEFFYCFGS